jgi:dTDP-4-amino-4,6-dideoxygalactose transaminase
MISIPVMRPRLANYEEIAPLLQRIDQNLIYSNRGPLVCELEEAYSQYFKVNKDLVVALSNATQAIQGLVSISKNENWIAPDYTFCATGLAVLNANRQLHICDVSLIDWKLDTNLIPKEQSSFGIIPVMPFGAQIDFNTYKDFQDVIIDAAASLGATLPKFGEMRESWAVVYSLHATKVLGAGEGALVVCGNHSQADSLRAWSNFGFSSDRTAEIQGTNAKMSEMNAAYAIYSFQNKNLEKEEWLRSHEYVTYHAADKSWMTFVNSPPQFHPYWIASFKDAREKRSIAERLRLEGIQTREWWAKPLSEQKAFSQSQLISKYKIARKLSNQHLGLPMHRDLSLNSVLRICEVIQSELDKSE